MCGISGYWDFKGKVDDRKQRNTVQEMIRQIRYRGPDEEGIYQRGGLCMGMRRLCIIDIQGGAQPVYNEDRSIAVVYNGEIYNFRKLRKQLKEKGHVFYTGTDTEVIVHAFEEYGTGSFDLFDGMYAFALYDVRNSRLYLVRDRMGEKPLYYAASDDFLLFGSELKCLMSAGLTGKQIHTRALNQFLQLTYIPAPLTIYEHVWKLRAGHFLEISANGTVRDIEYWDIPVTKPVHISYSQAVKKLRKLTSVSVKQRMVSDVPLGAFLSGGVDSASIAGLMSRAASGPVRTFTIGFGKKSYDERDRARQAAQYSRTVHHEKVICYDHFPAAMQAVLESMDEPFADSSQLPVFLLSRFAKEEVTAAVTGDAGDELFAGYNKYLMAYYGKWYRKIPKRIRNGVIRPLVKKSGSMGSLARKVSKVVLHADQKPCSCHRSLMHMGVKEDEIRKLLTVPFYDSESLDFIDQYYEKHPQATQLQKELYTDLKVVLEGDMLVKTDRMSMLNSLETRIPLLSKDVITFAMNLPDEYKLRGRQRKRILKDAMRPFLPKGFEKKPKHGFEIPVAEWMRCEMKEELERLLEKKRIEEQGYFRSAYVEQIMKEHFEGKRNRRDELWVLYVFEKWCEKEGFF